MSLVHAATADDLSAIRAFLGSAGLQASDLASAQTEFVAVREEEGFVAAGALQRLGSCGLLRSVVVSHDRRGMGLAHIIVLELERLARTAHIETLVLLTRVEDQFFVRRGYKVIDRGAVPLDVQASEEFRSLYRRPLICMVKVLAQSIVGA